MLLADIIDQYYRAGPEPGSFIALMVLGFIVALCTVPAWPWLLPRRLEDWMCDPRA